MTLVEVIATLREQLPTMKYFGFSYKRPFMKKPVTEVYDVADFGKVIGEIEEEYENEGYKVKQRREKKEKLQKEKNKDKDDKDKKGKNKEQAEQEPKAEKSELRKINGRMKGFSSLVGFGYGDDMNLKMQDITD